MAQVVPLDVQRDVPLLVLLLVQKDVILLVLLNAKTGKILVMKAPKVTFSIVDKQVLMEKILNV